ncbi:MAG: group 1 truncated hemoglobin [Flavobacteriales bacterium]|nr:group 1 truncated hemoglobin [Flavobacteriales bacterium]
MMKYTARLLAVLFAASTILVACDKDDDMNDMNPDEPTLYERVGGDAMVQDPNNPGQQIEQGYLTLRAVVDSAIFVIAADPQLQPYFETLLMEVGNGNLTGFTILSKNLTDFFAVATGSESYNYTGLSMKDAHDPAQNPRMAMKSNDADFDQFIADVAVSLDQNGVTDQELIGDLIALIETIHADVVQR